MGLIARQHRLSYSTSSVHRRALLSLLNGQPVIPVLKIANVADAVPLARALTRGGLPAVEITLRTADALEAIRRVVGEVENGVKLPGLYPPNDDAKARYAGWRKSRS